jgi:hypothetical protein
MAHDLIARKAIDPDMVLLGAIGAIHQASHDLGRSKSAREVAATQIRNEQTVLDWHLSQYIVLSVRAHAARRA